MTTLDELTPTTLTDVGVREAAAAYAHAVRGDFIKMRRAVDRFSEETAIDLMLACDILAASLAHRAYGRGRPTPPLALAVLAPDDPRLPQEET